MIQNVDWNVVYNDVIAASRWLSDVPAAAGLGGTDRADSCAGWRNARGRRRPKRWSGSAADKFTIEAHDIFFQPKEIEIPADQEVTLLLPNLGVTAHDFSIDALNIHVDIAPGETKEIKIKAPAGTYEFYCNVPGHKEAGMVGTLVARPIVAADTAATANENAAVDESQATQEAQGQVPAEASAQTVTAFDIYFEPKEVTIPANTDVTFTIPNDGVTAHDFSIDALNIHVDIAPGETKTVVVNAPPGSYEYYCNVPGHKEAGMVGTLIAE